MLAFVRVAPLRVAPTRCGCRIGDPVRRRVDPPGRTRSDTLFRPSRGELEIHRAVLGRRVARVEAGAVLRELAFFDGGPRSATAWAVTPRDVAAMSPDQRAAFELASHGLAHALLFALGRILATRLHRTNAKACRVKRRLGQAAACSPRSARYRRRDRARQSQDEDVLADPFVALFPESAPAPAAIEASSNKGEARVKIATRTSQLGGERSEHAHVLVRWPSPASAKLANP